MNPQFPHDSIYASIYPPNTHQPASSSRPHSQGIPHSNTPAPHGLPPLTSGNNSSSFGNEPYSTRTQPLPSPLLTRHGDHVNRPSSFPVYGPTAHTYFNAQTTNFVQAPQSQHSTPQSRPHSTSAQSQPHYTSAPGPSRLPDLLPMPPRGNGKLLSLGNEINPLQAEEETRPTHVVGSQGRRGILPSAAGRPAAVAGANTSGQKAAPTPPKDAEGKYPCPHCNKNYLHAKHLKRHLLRREHYRVPKLNATSLIEIQTLAFVHIHVVYVRILFRAAIF